jgi:hypothetical protein
LWLPSWIAAGGGAWKEETAKGWVLLLWEHIGVGGNTHTHTHTHMHRHTCISNLSTHTCAHTLNPINPDACSHPWSHTYLHRVHTHT